MNIPSEQLASFQALYKKEFKMDISLAEAQERASSLLFFMELCSHTTNIVDLPKRQYSPILIDKKSLIYQGFTL